MAGGEREPRREIPAKREVMGLVRVYLHPPRKALWGSRPGLGCTRKGKMTSEIFFCYILQNPHLPYPLSPWQGVSPSK